MTRLWTSAADWLEHRRTLDGPNVGFVPTMGALHCGHASLIERCRGENEIAVVSIFVNPTQFNDPNDLRRYPRTLEPDMHLLERLQVDDVLAPPVSVLYPRGYRFRVEPASPAFMESAYRPGFLTGVLTVVLKLLGMVRPTRAYFGEKDYQQLQAVTEMVREFFLPTEIVACPTVRASSGLAESSRNALLTPENREKAAGLYQALIAGRSAAESQSLIESAGFSVDYVEEHWGRRFVAASLGGIRLIDNVAIPENSCS
jgi:pantoate--beta-alanine ligase